MKWAKSIQTVSLRSSNKRGMSSARSCPTSKSDFMTMINSKKNEFSCLLKRMLRLSRLRTITNSSKSSKKIRTTSKIKSQLYETLYLKLNSNSKWPSKKTLHSKNFKIIKVIVPNANRLYTSLSFSKRSCLPWNPTKSINSWSIGLLKKSWRMFSKNSICLSSRSDMRQITTWKLVYNSKKRSFWRARGSCKWICNWLRWN